MKTKSEYKKNVKVTVKNNKAIVQDDFGRTWQLNGTWETETAITMMLAQTIRGMYEDEISVEDKFKITISIERMGTE